MHHKGTKDRNKSKPVSQSSPKSRWGRSRLHLYADNVLFFTLFGVHVQQISCIHVSLAVYFQQNIFFKNPLAVPSPKEREARLVKRIEELEWGMVAAVAGRGGGEQRQQHASGEALWDREAASCGRGARKPQVYATIIETGGSLGSQGGASTKEVLILEA